MRLMISVPPLIAFILLVVLIGCSDMPSPGEKTCTAIYLPNQFVIDDEYLMKLNGGYRFTNEVAPTQVTIVEHKCDPYNKALIRFQDDSEPFIECELIGTIKDRTVTVAKNNKTGRGSFFRTGRR